MSKILLGVNLLNARRGGDLTRLADVIVPEIFTGYTQIYTEQKSALIRSGAIVMDPRLNSNLAGGGFTFNEPFFRDLEDTDENISNDQGPDSTPNNITTGMETQVRLSRNNSWGSADLVAALIGTDPMRAISALVGDYWVRRLQGVYMATMKGVFAANDLPDSDFHYQGDMTHNVATAGSGSFINNVTNFTPSAFVGAVGTMGDSMNDLRLIMVHSIVYQRMQLLNLIDTIPDARGEVNISTYQGRLVIIDDAMPHTSDGTFESWIFGAGAVAMGASSPKVPTAVTRKEEANQGAGEEVLHNRVEWIIHPVGHAYVGQSPTKGGPSNAATTGNLANANSFVRVFNERKQIKMARLITKEF